MKYSEGQFEEYFIPKGNFLWNIPSERSITDIIIQKYNFRLIFVAQKPFNFKQARPEVILRSKVKSRGI